MIRTVADNPSPAETTNFSLLNQVDSFRIDAFGKASAEHRSELGQYPTPPKVASDMASMFTANKSHIRLLDAGAGVGSLTAAFVANMCDRKEKPQEINVTLFELDAGFYDYLKTTVDLCHQQCERAGVKFIGRVLCEDFIKTGAGMIQGSLFQRERFDCAILNPPYKKISSDSDARRLLRAVGIETSNLYTGFLGLSVRLLEEEGQLVAITPRSFCNGPYFKPFRQMLLGAMDIRRVHVFESRTQTFRDDDVVQENIIFHAIKTQTKSDTVQITTNRGPDEPESAREVPVHDLVKPDDRDYFIHIVLDENGRQVSEAIRKLPCSLDDIGLSVSTGPVVEFRSKQWLSREPAEGTVPLIYPMHFAEGWIKWPKPHAKKANHFACTEDSSKWLVQGAVYVLVKRFSAKEETRRIVAAVLDPSLVPARQVALENHLNYYHFRGEGLPLDLAKGLAAFLNSTVVDEYFRQFNGHTQVNATDLRSLPYPRRQALEELGRKLGSVFPLQAELDQLIRKELF